jgi:hypothetical protein
VENGGLPNADRAGHQQDRKQKSTKRST